MFDIKNGEQLTKLFCKNDVILLADVIEKFVKVSFEEYVINPLHCVSVPNYFYQCALKYTNIKLQTLEDKDMILLIENNICGDKSSVMSDRYVKTDENKKILYIDATNLYGHSMSQMLPYYETKFEKNICLEEILNTPDDNEIGYFIEVDLKYPDNIKEKTKNFPCCPENKKINPNKYHDFMNNIKPKNYTKLEKLICDWSAKKKYLIHYRTLKFYVRHALVIEKIHENISFEQSKWLEKYISFNTQKRNRAKNDFENDFFNSLVNVAFANFLENFRHRFEIAFSKRHDYKKIIKEQSKLTFNGIQKSYEKCDSYSFKRNQVVMDKAIYVCFCDITIE